MDKQYGAPTAFELLQQAATLSFGDQGPRAKATSFSFLHSTQVMPGAPLASLMDRDASHDAVFGHQLSFEEDNDGSMSDFDEDCEEDIYQEAFHAVFPQAPTLVKQHALRPVVDTLRMLIAKPECLVATLLPVKKGDMLKPQALAALEAKAQAYTQTHIGYKLTADDWKRVSGFSQRGAKHEERWTSPQLAQQVDALMTKLTIHYARVWNYITATAIAEVHSVETTITDLVSKCAPDTGTSREIGMVALMGARLSPQDSSTSLRPLRLRSQTNARFAALQPPSVPQAPAAAKPATPTPGSGANHRARLARQSNEFMIAWFLHHKANPYPSGAERVQIAKKTGLTEQQVRNWFANMRKRHWKPKHEKKSKQPRCLLDMLLRQNDSVGNK